MIGCREPTPLEWKGRDDMNGLRGGWDDLRVLNLREATQTGVIPAPKVTKAPPKMARPASPISQEV